MQVGKTILNQMMTLNRMYLWSWGSHAYKAFDSNQMSMLPAHCGGLIFRVNGKKHKGNVVISLQGNDLYRVSIGQYRIGKLKVKTEVKDVFVEDLMGVVDNLVET